MKWKLFLFVLVVGTTTHAIAGYDEGMVAYKSKDYATALGEWEPMARQGDARAQRALGILYANGQGVPKDVAQVAAWYRKAAEQGDAYAQYNLGLLYSNGQGVPKDAAQAVAWYRKAAEQAHAMAQNNLGFMYRNGQGVPKDVVLAYMLYNIAAANGNELAMNNRASLEEELSRAQTAEGQSLASAWKPGTPFPKTSRTGKIVVPVKKAAAAVPQPTPPKAAKSARVPAETVASGNCRPKTSRITCQSQCFNGDCVVTYANGCKMRVTVDSKFNPFTSQWEYPSPSC